MRGVIGVDGKELKMGKHAAIGKPRAAHQEIRTGIDGCAFLQQIAVGRAKPRVAVALGIVLQLQPSLSINLRDGEMGVINRIVCALRH